MKWFLPLLFIVYWGGITLFTHSHVVKGVTISHSHPFTGEHEHSTGQVETIFFLSSFVSPSFSISCAAAPVFIVLLCILHLFDGARQVSQFLKTISLRAPPSSFSC